MMDSQSTMLKKTNKKDKFSTMIIITIIKEQEAEEEVSIDKTMLTNTENLRKVTLKTTRMTTLEEGVEAEEAAREEDEEIINNIEGIINIKSEVIISIEKNTRNRL